MNNQSVIRGIAARLNLTTAEAKNALEVFVDVLTEGLTDDGKVTVNGLGTLEVKARKARKARNPKTGETVDVAAKNVVKFRTKPELQKAIQ